MKANRNICVLGVFVEGEWYFVKFIPGQEEEAAEALASYAEDARYSLSWEDIEEAMPEVSGWVE